MVSPFRRRHRDEIAELRAQVIARAKRATSVNDLAVVIDDAIDALDSLLAPPAVAENTVLLALTGPVRGQEWKPMRWSCPDPTDIDVTVDDARQIMREHLDCSAAAPAICRIKNKAMSVLAAAGVLTPDSRVTVLA